MTHTASLTPIIYVFESAPGIFRREYCLGVHGYILVFDATNRKSFDALKAIDEALNDMCADGIARVIKITFEIPPFIFF